MAESTIVQQPMPLGEPSQTPSKVYTSDPNRPAQLDQQIPDVPIGLEYLVPLNLILIKQTTEVLEAIAGIETANNYNVFTARGDRIYTAHETTGCCTRICGGPLRPFKINIHNPIGRSALYLDRPCDCCLYTTNTCPFFCGQIGGNMYVSLGEGGPRLGEVVHVFNCCKPKYKILDSNRQHILTISGPCCGDYCACATCTICGSTEFPLFSADGDKIGVIRKKFSGLFQEIFTDADNFGVEFPQDLSVAWKALVFAAVFLIDFMYFENNSG